MFSVGSSVSPAEERSKEPGRIQTLRFSDLHQPPTVDLFSTPVPKCPENCLNNLGDMISSETQKGVHEADISDSKISDVLKLLDSVDLSFLKERHAIPRTNMVPRRRTRLMDVLEVHNPLIFRSDGKARDSKPEETVGAGTEVQLEERTPQDVETPQHKRKILSSPIKSSRTDVSSLQKKKVKSRVSLKRNESDSVNPVHLPDVQEKVQGARAELEAALKCLINALSKQGNQFKERLMILKTTSSKVLPLVMVTEAFQMADAALIRDTLDALCDVVRMGWKSLVYEAQTESSASVLESLCSLEAVVLIERIVLNVAKTTLVPEESLQVCVEATRHHLQMNILPFHDSRIQAATRPKLKEDDYFVIGTNHDAMCDKVTREDKYEFSKASPPKILEEIIDRVSVSLSLLGDIIALLKIPTALSSPLIRTAVQSLTIEALPQLRTRIATLLASVYCACSEMKQSILEDVFDVLTPYLGVGRKCRRDVELYSQIDGSLLPVNILSALILQMVQGCAVLPSHGTSEQIKGVYASCIAAADQFWAHCMDRLSSNKAMKMEMDADFSCVFSGIVQDLLELSPSIHWPAASTILIRLVSAINSESGLQHPDALVRQLCVDIIGKMLTSLHASSATLNEKSESLDQLVANIGLKELSSQALTELVLRKSCEYESSSLKYSKMFLLLRNVCEGISKIEKSDSNEELINDKSAEILAAAWDSLKYHEGTVHEFVPDDEESATVMKAIVHEQFAMAAPAMLSWIMEILETRQQAPTTRAKAVRAIGDIVAVDHRLLDLPKMHIAIEHALQDDSISVREAALNLIGRHMVQDSALALSLIHIVIKATEDPGSSVRRSAIKILRDCTQVFPDVEHPRVIEAYKAILARSSDSEETVRILVLKMFKSLWFEGQGLETRSDLVDKHGSQKACAFARLTMSVVGTSLGPSNIRSLLDSSSPLVTVLKHIVDEEDDNLEGAALSESLLEHALGCQEDDASSLPFLHAIYVMALSNVDTCIPDEDPLKFVRSLMPYLKMPGLSEMSIDDSKISAEQTLCAVGIVCKILASMENDRVIVDQIASTISEDVVALINQHRFTAVLSASCMCLAACAMISHAARVRLLNMAAVYLSWLQDSNSHTKNLPRFIFIIGQIYRWGARQLALVETDGNGATSDLSPSRCLKILVQFWNLKVKGSPALAVQIQRSALEAMCQIMIAFPKTAISEEVGAQRIISEALCQVSSPSVKLTALNGLIELVQEDASALHDRQRNDSRVEKRGRKRKSMTPSKQDFAEYGRPAVATENGEGDISHSSAILQYHWNSIINLSVDIQPLQKIEEQPLVTMRRRVLLLMEIAVRDGLVGPWSTIPTLVIFSMDFAQDISFRSLKLLQHLCSKYPQYVDAGRLLKGIKDSYCQFERSQSRDLRSAQARIRKLYAEIISINKSKRNDFLRLMIRSFKSDLLNSASTTGSKGNMGDSADEDQPKAQYKDSMWPWLAQLICSLPFKRVEEVCLVIHEIDSILASRISTVVAELHELIESDVPVDHPTVRGCGSRAKMLCLLSRTKNYLLRAYSISPERQAVYSSALKRRASEDNSMASLNSKVPKLDISDTMFNRLAPSSVTPIEDLRILYMELDQSSEDHDKAFDPT